MPMVRMKSVTQTFSITQKLLQLILLAFPRDKVMAPSLLSVTQTFSVSYIWLIPIYFHVMEIKMLTQRGIV